MLQFLCTFAFLASFRLSNQTPTKRRILTLKQSQMRQL